MKAKVTFLEIFRWKFAGVYSSIPKSFVQKFNLVSWKLGWLQTILKQFGKMHKMYRCLKLKFSMLNSEVNVIQNQDKFTFEKYVQKCSELINTLAKFRILLQIFKQNYIKENYMQTYTCNCIGLEILTMRKLTSMQFITKHILVWKVWMLLRRFSYLTFLLSVYIYEYKAYTLNDIEFLTKFSNMVIPSLHTCFLLFYAEKYEIA